MKDPKTGRFLKGHRLSEDEIKKLSIRMSRQISEGKITRLYLIENAAKARRGWKSDCFIRGAATRAKNEKFNYHIKCLSEKYFPLALEARKKSEKCQKGVKNCVAKPYDLIGPDNRRYTGININQLVRDNLKLFNAEDIIWTKSKCRASQGISRVNTGRDGSWKDWRLCTKSSEAYSHWQKTTPEIDKVVEGAVKSCL